MLRRIAGLSEPQSVAYVPFADSVFVANAGDGSVRVLRAEDLTPIGRIALKRIVVDAYQPSRRAHLIEFDYTSAFLSAEYRHGY